MLFKEIQGSGDEAIYTYELIDAIKDGVLVQSELIELHYTLYEDEKDEISKAQKKYFASINNN